MAELTPVSFRSLVNRVYRESAEQGAVFDFPRRRWWFPDPEGPDLAAHFHDMRAGTPFGPAAGPHTQMAQNILLSYMAGGRILELKTVQALDQLDISRPCIDMATIGYNIEWSQELRIEESLREYVAGVMLVEMFRRDPELGGGRFPGVSGDYVIDMSVGYDLEGIRGEKVSRFFDGMADASAMIEKLRAEIPGEFAFARGLEYPTMISDSITLSTFHGCPAGEIEAIAEYLIGERGLNVVIKMNPPTLGRERLEHLLHDVMGYTDIRVNPCAYANSMQYDESLAMTRRLMAFAQSKGRIFGVKFSNTLEVENHRDVFKSENKLMYLSGQPLHVIAMALTAKFREDAGPHVPVSFSAGVDKYNFADMAACGFCPVTASTDLLRTGGYGRIGDYLKALSGAMAEAGVSTLDEWTLKAHGQEAAALRRAAEDIQDQTVYPPVEARWAGCLNTPLVAKMAEEDERYRAERNVREPKRIDSKLEWFDCLTCNKCIPVCPNAANFTYPSPAIEAKYRDVIVQPSGEWAEGGETQTFSLKKKMQIANLADFCNECGNCDTFCPEYGGPYIMKPSFFMVRKSFERYAGHDGFFVENVEGGHCIMGRIGGVEMSLQLRDGEDVFDDGAVEAAFDAATFALKTVTPKAALPSPHRLDVGRYLSLRVLLSGVLDPTRVNQVNAVNKAKTS